MTSSVPFPDPADADAVRRWMRENRRGVAGRSSPGTPDEFAAIQRHRFLQRLQDSEQHGAGESAEERGEGVPESSSEEKSGLLYHRSNVVRSFFVDAGKFSRSSAIFGPVTNHEQPVGFWSYTHRDDELNKGRIRRLADSIADEFEALTAEKLRIFVDKKDLEWGAEWRARIDAALTGTTFCIPIVTPAFFKSEECRKEVLTFSGHAKSLGLDELLLPILYVKVPGLTDEGNVDEVMSLIAQRQYIDWTSLRVADENSSEYRQAVARIAVRLVEILERSVDVASANELNFDSTENEAPALLETMAEAELALPRWTQVLQDFAEVMTVIGTEASTAATEMSASDVAGRGFAERVRISKELADRIADPVERFYELGARYSTELVKIDPAILTIIRDVSKQELSSDEKIAIREFYSVINSVVTASRENLPAIRMFYDSAGSLRGLSKVMRPIAEKIQSGLQQVLDGQIVLDEWERLIGEARI
jgi:hypothetical protein